MIRQQQSLPVHGTEVAVSSSLQLLPPDPMNWPQSPIMLRSTPNMNMKIRGIRYANSMSYQNDISGFGDSKGSDNDEGVGIVSLPINTGHELPGRSYVIDFESSLFIGTLLLRVKGIRSDGSKNFPDAIFDIEPLPLDPPFSQQQQQQQKLQHHLYQQQQRTGPMHNNLSLVGSPLSATTDDWDMRGQYSIVDNNNHTLSMSGQQPEPQMDLRSMQEYAFTSRQQQIQLMQLRIQEQKIKQLQLEILLEQELVAFDTANGLYNIEEVGSIE